jgi:hypothetical protein
MGQFWVGILIIAVAAAMGWWGTQVASKGWKKRKHSVWSGILIIAVAAAMGWWGTQEASEGWKKKAAGDIYKLMVTSTIRFKYPGQLLYFYNSQLGKTISPISLALFLEVANNKSSISRVFSLETKALMRYDEGGTTQINTQSSAGYKFSYIPSGKTVERWRNLHSVGFLHDQIYFVTIPNDWTKCKRIDFSKSSFEIEASNNQLQPGESLKGWVFYEMEDDVRTQLAEIKQLEFTIKNSAGEVQIIKIDYPKEGENFPIMSSGRWNILGGFYDLTKENYTLCPQIDLQTLVKEGKSIEIPASKKK